jgi:hypothetical protein
VADATAAGESAAAAGVPAPRPAAPLRGTLSAEAGFLWGAAAIGVVLGAWYLVTAPLFPVPVVDVAEAPAEREYVPLVSPVMLPGPGKVFEAVPRVFTERKLIPNTLVTLKRVILGFGLSAAIGVPLGVAAAGLLMPLGLATLGWRTTALGLALACAALALGLQAVAAALEPPRVARPTHGSVGLLLQVWRAPLLRSMR